MIADPETVGTLAEIVTGTPKIEDEPVVGAVMLTEYTTTDTAGEVVWAELL